MNECNSESEAQTKLRTRRVTFHNAILAIECLHRSAMQYPCGQHGKLRRRRASIIRSTGVVGQALVLGPRLTPLHMVCANPSTTSSETARSSVRRAWRLQVHQMLHSEANLANDATLQSSSSRVHGCTGRKGRRDRRNKQPQKQQQQQHGFKSALFPFEAAA